MATNAAGAASDAAPARTGSCKRVFAARIEDHHVHGVGGLVDAFHDSGEIDAGLGNVFHAAHCGVDRHQIVTPRQLQTVPGEIKQPHCFARGQRLDVSIDGGGHVSQRRVEPGADFKAGFAQLIADGACVVARIDEGGRVGVFAVTQHQCQLGDTQQLHRAIRLRPDGRMAHRQKKRGCAQARLQHAPSGQGGGEISHGHCSGVVSCRGAAFVAGGRTNGQRA